MVTATAIESYLKNFSKLFEVNRTSIKLCNICGESFTTTGYYKHINSNNHLLKAGELTNVNCVKILILKRSIVFAKLNAPIAVYS